MVTVSRVAALVLLCLLVLCTSGVHSQRGKPTSSGGPPGPKPGRSSPPANHAGDDGPEPEPEPESEGDSAGVSWTQRPTWWNGPTGPALPVAPDFIPDALDPNNYPTTEFSPSPSSGVAGGVPHSALAPLSPPPPAVQSPGWVDTRTAVDVDSPPPPPDASYDVGGVASPSVGYAVPRHPNTRGYGQSALQPSAPLPYLEDREAILPSAGRPWPTPPVDADDPRSLSPHPSGHNDRAYSVAPRGAGGVFVELAGRLRGVALQPTDPRHDARIHQQLNNPATQPLASRTVQTRTGYILGVRPPVRAPANQGGALFFPPAAPAEEPTSELKSPVDSWVGQAAEGGVPGAIVLPDTGRIAAQLEPEIVSREESARSVPYAIGRQVDAAAAQNAGGGEGKAYGLPPSTGDYLQSVADAGQDMKGPDQALLRFTQLRGASSPQPPQAAVSSALQPIDSSPPVPGQAFGLPLTGGMQGTSADVPRRSLAPPGATRSSMGPSLWRRAGSVDSSAGVRAGYSLAVPAPAEPASAGGSPIPTPLFAAETGGMHHGADSGTRGGNTGMSVYELLHGSGSGDGGGGGAAGQSAIFSPPAPVSAAPKSGGLADPVLWWEATEDKKGEAAPAKDQPTKTG